ncbi:broad specificity phosphatase PhoE [Pseudomonas oryzihabitans]|uniref:Histidine phosphatase family protein n=1 Tax=Pseudomonas flavocrustae TaxID=2991719 RepID=A0ABT6ICJ5_9PSED|nr:histidine phosphatase family protein [Pseudomonas sp. CBMAI 2609]MDH4762262.1 histidine phosphatase family protein [Pseudomonas sp. CBMAI 2609]
MQIILVRHGKPDLSSKARCTPREMKDWVARYQKAPVPAGQEPAETRRLAQEAGYVVSSPLSRCVRSLEYLMGCPGSPVDDRYAEAHLPYLELDTPRLPVKAWRLLFRSAWFLGFAAHTESIGSSSVRAGQAADHLIELAERHGSVLLLGHGIMNVLIAWQLRKRGWRGPLHLLLKDYWKPSIYRKETR